jgi:hypothetical protein
MGTCRVMQQCFAPACFGPPSTWLLGHPAAGANGIADASTNLLAQGQSALSQATGTKNLAGQCSAGCFDTSLFLQVRGPLPCGAGLVHSLAANAAAQDDAPAAWARPSQACAAGTAARRRLSGC